MDDINRNGLISSIDIPIERLDLSPRITKSLKRNGIHNIGELIAADKEDLICFRNIGIKSYNEIKISLEKHNPSKLYSKDLGENREILYTSRGYVSFGTRTSVLNLPDQLTSLLLRKGLVTIGQVVNCSDNMLHSYFHIGENDIKKIREQINILFGEQGGYSGTRRAPLEDTIDCLSFTTRVHNALLRYGITNIIQLIKMTQEEISQIRNIGENSLEEIISKLGDYKEKYETIESIETDKDDKFTDEPAADSKKSQDIFVQSNINELKRKIRSRISLGQLHPDIVIDGKNVIEWLNYQPIHHDHYQDKVFEILLESDTIGQEFLPAFIFDSRSLLIFIEYYSEESPTLADLSKIHDVSRERIRQLLGRAENKIATDIKNKAIPIFKTSMMIAEDLGDDLIFSDWVKILQSRNMLRDEIIEDDNNQILVDCTEFFIAFIIWANRKDKFDQPEIIESLYKSLEYKEASVKTIDSISEVSNQLKKKIKRTVIIQGGIKVIEVCNLTGLTIRNSQFLLKTLGIIHISNDWYSFKEVDRTSRQPIRTSAFKLLEASSGPIKKKFLINGVLSYLGRYSDTPAPMDVIEYYLDSLGFELNDGEYISGETYDEERLSNTENIFLGCVRELGPVISSNDVLPILNSKGFSNQSFYALGRNSPLPVTVASCSRTALFKLRGTSIEWEDIKKAAKRLDDIAATQKIKLNVNELHENFLLSIESDLSYSSSVYNRPIDIDFRSPLPEKSRIYLFNLINPLNKQISGHHIINIRVPGYKQGDQVNFNFSDNRIVLLMGYSPEYEVYVFWDASLYRNFPYNRQVTVNSKIIIKAVANGLAEYNRRLNIGILESIIVSRRDKITEGIKLRMLRTQNRLIQD